MRKFLFLFFLSAAFATAHAQYVSKHSVRDDFRRDVRQSASNQMAYPGPLQLQLTAPPSGYRPFYISHYGRHGSRYLIGQQEYDRPFSVLARADSAGMLTAKGKEVLLRVAMMRDEAAGRFGELTPLGAQQHREIASRLYKRFPEIFKGKANVDAKSTIVIRCILSMENELLELMRLNPQLNIRHDASEHDMYYMNLYDRQLDKAKRPKVCRDAFDAYYAKYVKPDHLISQLFSDTAYAYRNTNVKDFYYSMFRLASNLQNLEARKRITLWDLFDDDEIYNNWHMENMKWYMSYGACPMNGGKQPFSQRNLLRRIIEEADSCIALPKPGATLRFGHETMVLPLTCLMGINGYDLETDDIDNLEQKGWVNYRVFPMGANIQLVFYRRNAHDKDVLVKVLLNENEARLPVKTNCPPYYKWSDFRKYYLDKLATYK